MFFKEPEHLRMASVRKVVSISGRGAIRRLPTVGYAQQTEARHDKRNDRSRYRSQVLRQSSPLMAGHQNAPPHRVKIEERRYYCEHDGGNDARFECRRAAHPVNGELERVLAKRQPDNEHDHRASPGRRLPTRLSQGAIESRSECAVDEFREHRAPRRCEPMTQIGEEKDRRAAD